MSIAVGILGTLAAIFGVVREVLRGLNRTKPTATPKQQAEVEAHKARAESATGDTDAVNARMERYRLRKGLALAILAAVLVSSCTLIHDVVTPDPVPVSTPAVVVVSADRWQYPLTNSAGVVGWFVPSAVHADMMEAVELLDYYKTKLKEGRIKQ